MGTVEGNLQKVKYFLYFSSEEPTYSPNFEQRHLILKPVQETGYLFLEELLKQGKIKDLLNLVEEANDDKYLWRRENILYVLALCARYSNDEIKAMTYRVASKCLKTGKELIFFMYSLNTIKKGAGKGLRKLVNNVYCSLTLDQLADMICQRKTYFGWCHKRIITFMHTKFQDQDKNLLLAHTLFKFHSKSAELVQIKPSPEVQKHIERYVLLEEVAKCKDEQVLCKLITQHDLKVPQLPQNMLKSTLVWQHLIPRMSLEELLPELNRFRRLGCFKQKTVIQKLIASALKNPTKQKDCLLQPIDVLHAYKSFHRGHVVSWAKAKIIINRLKTQNRKYYSIPFTKDINSPLTPGFNKLLHRSFSNVRPLNERILCVFDPRHVKTTCRRMTNVGTEEAVALIVLSLLKTEANTTFGIFQDTTVVVTNPKKEWSLHKAVKTFGTYPCGQFSYGCGPNWSIGAKRPIDAFVYLIHKLKPENDPTITIPPGNPVVELERYRKVMNVPNARMIIIIFGDRKLIHNNHYANGVYYIFGLDRFVPRMLQACVKGKL